MNKKIKLSLLGTLIAGSALAVTLPIVSCSASTDVVVTPTADAVKATAAMTTYVASAKDNAEQVTFLTVGHKITTGTAFTALLASVTFVQADDTTITPAVADVIDSFEVTTAGTVPAAGAAIPAGAVLTVNLKDGYTTDVALTITLGALGNAK